MASSYSTAMLIRKLECFGKFSETERQAITDLPATIRHLGAGQDIARDHDRPSHCCLILDGWACRYQFLNDGSRQIFSFHIPGDIPNLQSLHLPALDYTVCTLTRGTAAFIPHERLHELTVAFPRIAAAIWREVHVDAAVLRAWLAGMGRRTACEALAHLFCELYIKLEVAGLAQNHCFHLPVTQGEIADALGLSNVHINRVLGELRTRDLITLRSHEVQIHNWTELTRMCDFDPAYLHLAQRAA